MDKRKISICIPTFNRLQQTINSFVQVLDDDRVSEICISDDCSTDLSCENLVEYSKTHPKVKVFRNRKNVDCYRNKAISMMYATNPFAILLDSDNTIDKAYLDALYAVPAWDNKTIYQPSYAVPHFDFRKWEGLTITRENVAQYADTHLMTSLNAQNDFINCEEFLSVWNGTLNPGSSDSLFFSYTWVKNGGKIYITPNLIYQHYISEKGDGHYQQNSANFVQFHAQLMERIKQLR